MDSPKTRLLARKVEAKAVMEVADSPFFQVMADMALLQFVHDLPDTLKPEEAAASYHRVIGARDFLAKLASIADKPTPAPQTLSSANLNHKV